MEGGGVSQKRSQIQSQDLENLKPEARKPGTQEP